MQETVNAQHVDQATAALIHELGDGMNIRNDAPAEIWKNSSDGLTKSRLQPHGHRPRIMAWLA